MWSRAANGPPHSSVNTAPRSFPSGSLKNLGYALLEGVLCRENELVLMLQNTFFNAKSRFANSPSTYIIPSSRIPTIRQLGPVETALEASGTSEDLLFIVIQKQ